MRGLSKHVMVLIGRVTLSQILTILPILDFQKALKLLVMHSLVDCWIVWMTNIMLYYLVCVPTGRGNFLCVLRPVSRAQCRARI